jgi:hypothetical protein
MDIAGCGKSSIVLLIAMRASHVRSISCKPVYRIGIKGPRNVSHLLYYARRTIAACIPYQHERKTRSAHIGHPARGRSSPISGSLNIQTSHGYLEATHSTPHLPCPVLWPAAPILLCRDQRTTSTWNRRLSRFDDARDTRARIGPRASCFFRTFDHPGADERSLNWDETHSRIRDFMGYGLRMEIGLGWSAVCSENECRDCSRRTGHDVRWRI